MKKKSKVFIARFLLAIFIFTILPPMEIKANDKIINSKMTIDNNVLNFTMSKSETLTYDSMKNSVGKTQDAGSMIDAIKNGNNSFKTLRPFNNSDNIEFGASNKTWSGKDESEGEENQTWTKIYTIREKQGNEYVYYMMEFCPDYAMIGNKITGYKTYLWTSNVTDKIVYTKGSGDLNLGDNNKLSSKFYNSVKSFNVDSVKDYTDKYFTKITSVNNNDSGVELTLDKGPDILIEFSSNSTGTHAKLNENPTDESKTVKISTNLTLRKDIENTVSSDISDTFSEGLRNALNGSDNLNSSIAVMYKNISDKYNADYKANSDGSKSSDISQIHTTIQNNWAGCDNLEFGKLVRDLDDIAYKVATGERVQGSNQNSSEYINVWSKKDGDYVAYRILSAIFDKNIYYASELNESMGMQKFGQSDNNKYTYFLINYEEGGKPDIVCIDLNDISQKGNDSDAVLKYLYNLDPDANSANRFSVKNLWDKCTDSQRLILWQEYYSRTRDGYNEDNLFTELTDLSKDNLISSAYSNSKTNGTISSANLKSVEKFNPEHATLAKEEVEKHLENNTMEFFNDALDIATNAELIVKYIVFKSLYYDYSAGETNEDTDMQYYIYNGLFEQALTMQYNLGNVDGKFQMSLLPADLGLLNTQGYGNIVHNKSTTNSTIVNYMQNNDYSAWNQFICVLYNIQYAAQIMIDSEIGTQAQVSWSDPDAVQKIAEWLNDSSDLGGYDVATAATTNFNGNYPVIHFLKLIKEVYGMLDFLEMTDLGMWSKEIDNIIRFYQKIDKEYPGFWEALENNPTMYAHNPSGSSTYTEPLGKFFNISDRVMSDEWCQGFALSALFTPFVTNIYNRETFDYIGDKGDWLSDFYYKYGFFRKALYINTDNAELVNKAVKGIAYPSSAKRPATLKDLLNYDRDIILTVDPNFYNADSIVDATGKIDLIGTNEKYAVERKAEDIEDSGSSTDNNDTDTNIGESITSEQLNLGDQAMMMNMDELLKTNSNKYYSESVALSTSKMTENPEDVGFRKSGIDAYILSAESIIGSKEKGIQSVLDYDEYTPTLSYGVVSAVYRDIELYNTLLTAIANDDAIFESSYGVLNSPGTNSNDWWPVLNYCMLANMEEQIKYNTKSNLDINAPIFVDLFGNIITESGYIIIPAASNVTLCNLGSWNPNTVGWATYYNHKNKLRYTDMTDTQVAWFTNINGYKTYSDLTVSHVGGENADNLGGNGFFTRNTKTGNLDLDIVELTSGALSTVVNWPVLNANADIIKTIFWNDAYRNKAQNIYSDRIVNLVTEVLRGAPIENIDYEKEGISGTQDVTGLGVYVAYKLESLIDALKSNTLFTNSLTNIPNLAFMPGVEYVALLAVKIAIAILVVVLAVRLIMAATQNKLGFREFGAMVLSVVMVFSTIVLMPKVISYSYNRANASLLVDEAVNISMLNYVKNIEGQEIGITSIQDPETMTKLYIKVGDVSVNWLEILPKALLSSEFKTVGELYESQLKNNPIALQQGVVRNGSGLYMDIQDIYDTTNVTYDVENKVLMDLKLSKPISDDKMNAALEVKNSADYTDKAIEESRLDSSNMVASYVLPYYVFLDQLIANINVYNTEYDVQTYTYDLASNGDLIAYDVISPYLTSVDFMAEGYDILALDRILKLAERQRPLYEYVLDDQQYSFTDKGLDSVVNVSDYNYEQYVGKSEWWAGDNKLDFRINTNPSDLGHVIVANTGEKSVISRIDKVESYARQFVEDNKDLLGNIPDAVFLKCMAMTVAIHYNQEFGIPHGNAVELYNVDTRDMMRFMAGTTYSVYKNYPYSFARALYNQGGTAGTLLGAIFYVLLIVAAILKPILLILVFILMLINTLFRKVLFDKESDCYYGYFITCGVICALNFGYALGLKIIMLVSKFGFGAITGLILGTVIQILYIVLLAWICTYLVRDWKDLGFNRYMVGASALMAGMTAIGSGFRNRVFATNNQAYKEAQIEVAEWKNKELGDVIDSIKTPEEMIKRDRERANAMNVADDNLASRIK